MQKRQAPDILAHALIPRMGSRGRSAIRYPSFSGYGRDGKIQPELHSFRAQTYRRTEDLEGRKTYSAMISISRGRSLVAIRPVILHRWATCRFGRSNEY